MNKTLNKSFLKFLVLCSGGFIASVGSGRDGLSAAGPVYILFCLVMGEVQLWQIGIGVSSIFSSLIEPAFKATVTDLLSEEEYTKASGFVQISGYSNFFIPN